MKKIHIMHRTKIAPIIKKKKLKRELFKAYMYPLRFVREVWRWFLFPFKVIRIIYWAITGKLKPVWDGG